MPPSSPAGRSTATFQRPGHDHRRCIDGALAAAEERCRRRGAKLTELRRRVLELVWQGHEPVGAYALLDALRAEGRAAAPPTVYRALDFLLSHGLIHRIEKANAFIGCPRPDDPHAGQFLMCVDCGTVIEMDDPALGAAVAASAAKHGFAVSCQMLEVEGHCPSCNREAAGG